MDQQDICAEAAAITSKRFPYADALNHNPSALFCSSKKDDTQAPKSPNGKSRPQLMAI